MTSKRMGIVLIALLALWSLAGFGSFVSLSNNPGDVGLGVSLVYAGDPDDYTAPNGGQEPDGDPDDYTDPGPADENEAPSSDDEEYEVDEVRTLLEIALLVLFGVGK